MPTTLLLHADGANGSTAIVDEVGHAVTVNGNAQISTAQGKFGGAALLFDGNGDYLSIANSTDFDFGTGDFTIEMWVYLESVSGNHHLVGRYNGNATSPIAIYQNASNIAFYSSSNGSSWDIVSGLSFGTFSTGTWYHLVVTRNGTTFRTFKDGVLANSTTSSGTLHANSGAVTFGANNSGAEGYNGYLDEIRIIKGEALYTAGFTPPAQRFFYQDTVLLLHMDGANASTTFRDETGKTLVAFGNAQISTAQGKYGGASALFDGAGDYLSYPTAGTLLGSSEFTLECWVRFSSVGTVQRIIDTRGNSADLAMAYAFGMGSSGNTNKICFEADTSNAGAGSGAWEVALYGTTTVSANTWYHVAVVRIGGSWKLYVDGVQEASVTSSIAIGSEAATGYIGAGCNGASSIGYYLNGYIDDLRVCKSAKYTANFTPPISAHEYEYTTLLIHGDGANAATCVRDESGKAVTVAGNAQISTAQSKFGGAALIFDGTGDYLSVTEIEDFNGFTSSASWTVEMWVRQATNASGVLAVIGDNAGGVCAQFSVESSGANQSIYIRPQGGSTGYWIQNAYAFDTGWHHLAFVCNAGSFAIYRDGVSLGTPVSFSWTTTNIPVGVIIGATYVTGYTTFFNGYLDEIRISKGIARYTAGFTPPASPFTLLGQYTYTISGSVYDDTGALVARTIRLYRRDTGALVAETTSTGGTFTFHNPDDREYYVVSLDDAAGAQHNALIFDKVVRG